MLMVGGVLPGDRVQWFRAEAEMYRWMEQFETKHAEFGRTILFFSTMEATWNMLAKMAQAPGTAAYGKRKASMYSDLAKDANARYKQVGHPDFINIPEGKILADVVAEWRTKWLAWMTPLVCVCACRISHANTNKLCVIRTCTGHTWYVTHKHIVYTTNYSIL